MRTAHAAPPAPSIAVRPSACEDTAWSRAEWIEALRVELDADGMHLGPRGEDSIEVSSEPTTCGASTTVAVLTCSAHGTMRVRSVALSDVEPIARPRVLAIAMAELIRSTLANAPSLPRETERAIVVEPPPSTRSESSPPSSRARAPVESAPSIALVAVAETRVFAQGGAALFGARAGATFAILPWALLECDGGALFGNARDSLGDVDATLASLGIGLLAGSRAGALLFAVGPRVELGFASFDGHAAAPSITASSVSAPIVLAAMTARASFPIVGAWGGLVDVDAGTTALGYSARADDRHAIDFAGPVLSTRIGFEWRFGFIR